MRTQQSLAGSDGAIPLIVPVISAILLVSSKATWATALMYCEHIFLKNFSKSQEVPSQCHQEDLLHLPL